jgi:hypothetical protein
VWTPYAPDINEIFCTSPVTTPTSGTFCSGLCDYRSTAISGFSTDVCPHSTGYTWKPEQSETTLGYQASALYLIHQRSDLDWHPSGPNVSIIVPSVVIPVVVLSTLILGILLLLRRRKQRRKGPNANIPAYGVKAGQGLKDIDRSSPVDLELEDTARFELDQSAAAGGAELDLDHEIREAADTSRRAELEDTGRRELGGATRARSEESRAGTEKRLDHAVERSYDNEPFERYPSTTDPAPNSGPIQRLESEDRLVVLERESARLDEDMRRLQMADLMEQKRRIDEEIAALRAR